MMSKDEDQVPTIVTAFQYLFKKELCTDFTFFTSDRPEGLKTHKLVLMLHSPVLCDIINELPSCSKIHIDYVSSLTVEKMLRYFYDENITLKNVSDVKEMKILADKYQICNLGNICMAELQNVAVDVSNVIDALIIALEFKNKEKEEECLMLISKNKEKVFSSELFLTMTFEKVLKIFEKLRYSNLITEAVFLYSALQWLEVNNSMHKKSLLLGRVKITELSKDEFLDVIISFPEFFSNIEISNAIKGIKYREKSKEVDAKNKSLSYRSIATNTENKFPVQDCILPKIKKLSIHTLSREDGYNLFNWKYRAVITTYDDIGIRSFHMEVHDNFKTAIIGSLPAEYTFYNLDFSYEGLYYFIFLYMFENRTSVSPILHLDVLKAALFFKIKELTCKVFKILQEIECYDPIFLDGLRNFPELEERSIFLSLSKPFDVLLHPNFIKSAPELLNLILRQNDLGGGNEVALLQITIDFLESRKFVLPDDDLRFQFLNQIAFENISIIDLEFIIKIRPNFFLPEEKKSIFAYKGSLGDDPTAIALCKHLPHWYSFRSRKWGRKYN